MRYSKLFFKILAGIFLLIVFVLGIKSLKEPDTYWMLLTGEWISAHGEVVKSDPFSFTRFSNEWINVKWLFEILIYGWQQVFGLESIPLIQSFIYLALFIFLWKRSFVFFKDKANQFLGLLIISIIVLLGVEFRMLGRPEMISHFFLVLHLFILESYHRKPGNFIYLLIPIQMIWANAHEAFGVGMVILVIYACSALIESLLLKRKVDQRLLLALSLALLAVGVNPRGIGLYLHPLNILNQVELNKYTYELVGFKDPVYWKMEAFIFLFLFFLGVIGIIRSIRKTKDWWKQIIVQYSMGWILLFFAFFYLAFTAYRNIPFFIFFAAPFIMAWVNQLLENHLINKKKMLNVLSIALISFLIFFYYAIVSNNYYRISNRSERYGLEIDVLKNPVGLSNFMKKINISGLGFSDYLSSSYLLWDLRPEFKSFIDLRDLDVFEPAFFDAFFRLNNEPNLFFEFDKAYDFQYAVINRPELQSLQRVLDQHPKWELLYADPVATFYLKKNEKNQAKIDSLNSNLEGSIFKKLKPLPTGKFSYAINKLLNPFYEPNQRVNAFNHQETAAYYFMSLGDYNAAYYHAKLDEQENGISTSNSNLKGRIYLELYLLGSDQQQSYFKQAQQNFQEALNRNSSSFDALKGLGILAYSQGNLVQAESFLNKALEAEKDFESLSYMSEILAQLTQANSQKLDQFYAITREAYELNPYDFIINYKLLLWQLDRKNCDEVKLHLNHLISDARADQAPYSAQIYRAKQLCR